MAFGDRMRDAIRGKTKDISDTLSEKYRARVGEELTQREDRVRAREAELILRAKKLDEREAVIGKREKELGRYFLVRRAYVIGPLLLVVLAAIATSVFLLRSAGVVGATTSATGSVSDGSVGQSSASEGGCVERGVAYYKEIGSYPRLSTGEDAERKVRDACSSTNGLAFSR